MIWISAIVTLFMIATLFIRPAPNGYPFNKEQAVYDIRNGQVRLITFGIAGPSGEMNEVASKYGFQEVNAGCVVGYTSEEKEYTELVTNYLNKRNGEGWKERYYMEIDSLSKALETGQR
jgi:hypothetical protein